MAVSTGPTCTFEQHWPYDSSRHAPGDQHLLASSQGPAVLAAAAVQPQRPVYEGAATPSLPAGIPASAPAAATAIVSVPADVMDPQPVAEQLLHDPVSGSAALSRQPSRVSFGKTPGHKVTAHCIMPHVCLGMHNFIVSADMSIK